VRKQSKKGHEQTLAPPPASPRLVLLTLTSPAKPDAARRAAATGATANRS